MQNKHLPHLYKSYFRAWKFCLEYRIFISYWIISIFDENESRRKKIKQSEKGGNYEHFNKIDMLNNDNGNANKVIV